MNLNKNDLDNYITGHYGEDQFPEDNDDPVRLEELVMIVKMDTMEKVEAEVKACGYTMKNFEKWTATKPAQLLNLWNWSEEHQDEEPIGKVTQVEPHKLFILEGDSGGSNRSRVYLDLRPTYRDEKGRLFSPFKY